MYTFAAPPSIAVVNRANPTRRLRPCYASNSTFKRWAPYAHHSQQPGRQSHLTNLHELTERISDLLHVNSKQKNTYHCPTETVDERMAHLHASKHIVLIFGKRLIRDQVSVEYAKRIVTLVKQIAAGQLDPDIICFAGGRPNDGSCLSEAAAGYSFFRSVCDEAGVDVSSYSYLLEEKSSNTLQNVRNVINELRRRCTEDSLVHCHFTLISSDYHLIRLQEVHRYNARQSALFPLQLFSATWSYIFAAYPFCVSRDPVTAFLGRSIVLANDLGIVLVNLNAAIADRQFIARENLHRLNETFAELREMYRVIDSRASSVRGLRTDMRNYAETLELAIHRVREVQTLLGPLSELGVTIPRADLELSQRLLMSAVRDIRENMDPDRVLRVADRVAVTEDMTSYVGKWRPSNGFGPSAGSGKQSDGGDGKPTLNNGGDHNDYEQRPSSPRGVERSLDSELAGHDDVRFEGNGKKIARDGPNVVVLDQMATANPAAATGLTTKQPGAQCNTHTGNGALKNGSVVGTEASQPSPSASTTAPRKRRSGVAQKSKPSASRSSAKRKSSSSKSREVA